MKGLKFLILAYNQFNGSIPSKYRDIPTLQALHISTNKLTAAKPSLGKLTSLLWLMLANNSLTGGIPSELENCSNLLWLNLANNQLPGPISPQLARIGSNLMPTFLSNRAKGKVTAGTGECFAMKRWILVDYPPFSFIFEDARYESRKSVKCVELPLTRHELYKQIVIDPPCGVLFYGLSNIGKTMHAKAVANHTTAAFIRFLRICSKVLGRALANF
ncbi:hypothetical protein P3S67_019291 [Capsicum chacoense]